MMTPDEKYEYYLRNNNFGERAIELITITHSELDEAINICPEPNGLSLTLEDSEVIEAIGVNMRVERQTNSKTDTDEKFKVTIEDEHGYFQTKIDKVPIDSDERFVVTYRIFMATDTSAPAIEPVKMEATGISFVQGGLAFECEVPNISTTRSGELYTFERFPTLKSLR